MRNTSVGVRPARLRVLPGDRRRARLWWLGLPVVPIQGYRLIRTIPRFTDADGVTGRVGSGDRRMKVVALGDSVTAGYAVGHHRSSVAGQLALRLADRHDATVEWEACAMTGATAGRALDLVRGESLGDADRLRLHRRQRPQEPPQHDPVPARARDAPRCGPRRAASRGVPPRHPTAGPLPCLPRPLADALGWRGRVFDAIGVAAVEARERTFRIETDQPLGPEMFAGDGFHPSPTLHAAFADAVLAAWPR